MVYTALPSIKGQITIPSELREKYNIGKSTPVVIQDQGGGVLIVKIMNLVDYDEIQYRENDKEIGVNFKKGIDPETLIKAIQDIDG